MSVHIVNHRVVLTYEPEPDGWPTGVITGYEHEDGFRIEHVISFVPSVKNLLGLVRAGLAEAKKRGYAYLQAAMPLDFPLTHDLWTFAERYGFEVSAVTNGWVYLTKQHKGE
jgi:hypothetical protein